MKEYKAIKVKYDFELEKVNEIMNEMAKEGWEVVCMAQEHPSKTGYVVTFCREKND